MKKHTYDKEHKQEEETNKTLVTQASPLVTLAFLFPRMLICNGTTPTTLENRSVFRK